MLRLIIGYVKLRDDTWEDMYRRLKRRLADATLRFHIKDWIDELNRRKQTLHLKMERNVTNLLLLSVFSWSPREVCDEKLDAQPRIQRGRPRTTWQQYVTRDA